LAKQVFFTLPPTRARSGWQFTALQLRAEQVARWAGGSG